VAPVNLKVGLTNRVDVQLVVDTHVRSTIEDRVAGTVDRVSGLGDVQTRVKVNLWGNDGGRTALAVMPFVKWPLSETSLRNGKTEGGVILPLAVELPRGWGLGAMAEVDLVRNAANNGHDAVVVGSIAFGRDLTARLGSAAMPSCSSPPAPGTIRGRRTWASPTRFARTAGSISAATSASRMRRRTSTRSSGCRGAFDVGGRFPNRRFGDTFEPMRKSNCPSRSRCPQKAGPGNVPYFLATAVVLAWSSMCRPIHLARTVSGISPSVTATSRSRPSRRTE
jgi:hypothetical protein